jgi:hypothetical protein
MEAGMSAKNAKTRRRAVRETLAAITGRARTDAALMAAVKRLSIEHEVSEGRILKDALGVLHALPGTTKREVVRSGHPSDHHAAVLRERR